MALCTCVFFIQLVTGYASYLLIYEEITAGLLMKPVPAPMAFTGDISNFLDSILWVWCMPRNWNLFCHVKVQYGNIKIN